ncbi:hypothetical protein SKAU_G00367260 [Synaphobranchus kaupii]|uniref:Uncharacterized protein n=1 Tax=Synaphobranchus kaupii TaxID=118154 RepID=A0A9Q1EFG0_SYNKA|nr:hypothetical protein SKAU_G00367260 [Synaphobranchus kaupii]
MRGRGALVDLRRRTRRDACVTAPVCVKQEPVCTARWPPLWLAARGIGFSEHIGLLLSITAGSETGRSGGRQDPGVCQRDSRARAAGGVVCRPQRSQLLTVPQRHPSERARRRRRQADGVSAAVARNRSLTIAFGWLPSNGTPPQYAGLISLADGRSRGGERIRGPAARGFGTLAQRPAIAAIQAPSTQAEWPQTVQVCNGSRLKCVRRHRIPEIQRERSARSAGEIKTPRPSSLRSERDITVALAAVLARAFCALNALRDVFMEERKRAGWLF